MTECLYSPKIKPEHLARKAIVYLRQSSEKQVRQNKESQRLQLDLAERMRSLGWQEVEIVGSDLGSSAAIAAARREGFERVLSSVALGTVGVVGSREVSRLSRTDKDWCRLLEVCQIFGTLIADVQLVFTKFRERWSVRQTFQWFRDHDIELPANPIQGTQLVWKIPSQSLIGDILRNPFYAGAYVWGRRPVKTVLVEGRLEKRQGAFHRAEECRVFIPEHHVGYIAGRPTKRT